MKCEEHRRTKVSKGTAYIVNTDDKSQTTYKCQKCEMIFHKAGSAITHFHRVHKEKTIMCPKCHRLFPFKAPLKKHLICDGVKKIKSPQQKLKDVDYHVTEGTRSDMNYNCNKCEEKFRTSLLVRSHIHSKHREKTFRCELCDKLFAFNHTLNYHKKTNHGEGGLDAKCKICDKVCKNLLSLKNHYDHAHKERKFKCMNCEMKFPYLSNLKVHSKKCENIKKALQDGIERYYKI